MDRTDHERLRDELLFYYKKFKTKNNCNSHVEWNKRNQDSFDAAVKICDELQADPELFIASIFKNIDAEKILPAFLHSKDVKQYYRKFVEEQSMPIEDLYDLQLMYLKNQVVQAKRSVEQALMDDDLGFHPWFRICVTKEVIPEVINKYLAEAKEQVSDKLISFLKKKNLDYKRLVNEQR